MKRGKNKNFKEKIKDWLIAIGICLGLLLMGGEGDDWNTIWVNLLGIGVLLISAYFGGACKKETC